MFVEDRSEGRARDEDGRRIDEAVVMVYESWFGSRRQLFHALLPSLNDIDTRRSSVAVASVIFNPE